MGDLHPFLALATELRARGHQAIIATHAVYQPKVESLGFPFRPLRPDYDPTDRESHRKIMHSWRGTKFILNELFSVFDQTYADLEAATQTAGLLISHPIVFPAPLLAEATGIPWVSVVLAPISMFSAYDPPQFLPIPWLNRAIAAVPQLRAAFHQLARWNTEIWSRPIMDARAARGLTPGMNPILEGQHSPLLSLALFSEVFAQPQPDWPSKTVQTGFLFYDTQSQLAPDLAEFLAEDGRPIVFTLGSAAVVDPGTFFARSFEAARRMGTRAILIAGPHARQFRRTRNIFVADYAPFAQLLPHAAAVVHQGGIGTTAQVLRAGCPALIVPFAHDQFDNAARVVRLGTGRRVTRHHYTIDTAELELGMLLGDPSYSLRALEIAEVLRAEDATCIAADAIERVFARA